MQSGVECTEECSVMWCVCVWRALSKSAESSSSLEENQEASQPLVVIDERYSWWTVCVLLFLCSLIKTVQHRSDV